ncbi:hypothetical protein CDL15_Pgr006404 [Punica granatum]|uniref:Uncharacterized protein n=1 Tax=Punica granatum TaxID=22663 RepID=A0A218VTZ4_PUNGR|nr:hypothetical protein CDL15_Pgr006404 [Punica granatum]
MELEEARFGPLSKAMSSAMSEAIWLTFPSSIVMRIASLEDGETGDTEVGGMYMDGGTYGGGTGPTDVLGVAGGRR